MKGTTPPHQGRYRPSLRNPQARLTSGLWILTGRPNGFSGDRLQLRSAGRGKPTSTYAWGCTLEQPDTDRTFQNGREAMWPMIAEAGLRCDECRHTIQQGRLCLSEIPEEKPTGTNRTDFRNYCIGCPQCWAQGKHACFVRRLDRRSDTTGPTPRRKTSHMVCPLDY